MASGVAVDAGKAMVRVTALDEAPDYLRLKRAPRALGGMQLGGVALRALPERARAWPAFDTDRRAATHQRSPSLPASVGSCSCAFPSGEQRIYRRAIYIKTRRVPIDGTEATARYRTALNAD